MRASPSLQKYLDDLDEQWAYERGMRKGVEQSRGEMQAVTIDLVSMRLGARFDDTLEQAVRRLTVPELAGLVRSLIPVVDEAEALAIVLRACAVEPR